MLYKCPFKYKRQDPSSGRIMNGTNSCKDDHNVRACNTGKGSWCLICQHYNQFKVSLEEWQKGFDNLGKSGKVSWLRPKLDRERFEKLGSTDVSKVL